MRIPFNRPWLAPNQLDYVADSLSSGWTAGGGIFTQRVQDLLGDLLGSPILLTPSCTLALEMAALLCDIKPGDNVIVPSYTFVSTASAFAREGAELRFSDIEEHTLNMDPEHVRELADHRTRVIVAVHYAGVPCDMAAIASTANEIGATIVEDSAHSLLGAHDGRSLGTIGRFGAYSFHETKDFVCGEGGAIAINWQSDLDRARAVRDKGTNRDAFLAGLVDKYTWVEQGSSFLLADPLAAMLLAQLEARDEILCRRRRRYHYYMDLLADAESEGLLARPPVRPDAAGTFHMFYVLLKTEADRNRCLERLRRGGIGAVFHYVPLHSSPVGKRYGHQPCPHADSIASRIIRLPFFNDISGGEQEEVVERLVSDLRASAGRNGR